MFCPLSMYDGYQDCMSCKYYHCVHYRESVACTPLLFDRGENGILFYTQRISKYQFLTVYQCKYFLETRTIENFQTGGIDYETQLRVKHRDTGTWLHLNKG